jgi:hypothetical protein
MPRTCTICAHPQRAAIDASLLARRIPRSELSATFRVSQDALDRHAAHHLPATLSKAHAAAEVAHADTLLDQLRALQRRGLAALDRAEEAGDFRVGALLLREARGCLTLLARMTGELVPKPEPDRYSYLLTPEWIRLRGAIVGALEPFPEARIAVAAALEGFGGQDEAAAAT